MKTRITKKDWHILASCGQALRLFLELIAVLEILDHMKQPNLETVVTIFFVVGLFGLIIGSVVSYKITTHYEIITPQ